MSQNKISIKVLGSGSSGNSILVDSAETGLLMLDCGLNYNNLLHLSGFRLVSLRGCLISHQHGDHCRSAKDLGNKSLVTIYGLQETLDAIYKNASKKKAEKEKRLCSRAIKHMEKFSIGSIEILPFEVKHDVPNVGYLISISGYKILYITDTARLEYKFDGVTHLIIGINYQTEKLLASHDGDHRTQRVLDSHMSLAEGLRIINEHKTDLRQIDVIHLSDRNTNKEEMRQAIERLNTGADIHIF